MTITFPKPEGWVPPPPALPPSAYEGPPVGRQGQKFVPNPRRGYTSLRVLPFLEGKPWDWIALSYVQALRPSTLRVTQGSMQLDADLWRVTVDLQQDGKTIRSHSLVPIGKEITALGVAQALIKNPKAPA